MAVAAAALGACRTRRVLEIRSDPPGAIVRFDEDVIGRTPLEHEFVHFGRRRITLYHGGYRTWSRRVHLKPPWYSRFPLDLVTEVLLPLGLEHRFEYDVRLREDTGHRDAEQPEVEEFVERALARRRGEDPGEGPDAGAPVEPEEPR